MPWKPTEKVEIVAEIGANHGSNIDTLTGLIQAAKDAGADAVKLQVYTPESMTLDAGAKVDFASPWQGSDLFALYREGALPLRLYLPFMDEANRVDIPVIISVFSVRDTDFVMSQARTPAALKIASFEMNDPVLIHHAAGAGLPLIISTGMANSSEIEDAIDAAAKAEDLTILHCVSLYPTPMEAANLPRIRLLHRSAMMAPGMVKVGLSDHTQGIAAPIAAVGYGISMIEKHIKSPFSVGGLDAAFSLIPMDFKRMVRGVRDAEKAGRYNDGADAESRSLRRSLWVTEPIKAGEVFTALNVRSLRPAGGLAPAMLMQVIGNRATKDLDRGHALKAGDVHGLGQAAIGG